MGRLRRVGFHSEKRALVRSAEFRALPPAIQEAKTGTSFETLKKVHDKVTVEDIREAELARDKALSGRNRKQERQAEGE